ncbi:MAG: GTP cyclohydrolase II [Epsilonproteobacteria bacterium]|nr:GTP cyclohydrolase II [Campylobacterota bacterium]
MPAVAQEYGSNEVLMVGFMNQEALALTLKTKIAHYFSRSKNRIWKKGETSGNIQKVVDVKVDCDADTILLIIEQVGNVACHTGAKSCFFNSFEEPEIKRYPLIKSGIADLPTRYGKFKVKAYKDGCQEHLAIMSQDFFTLEEPIVRIHSECLTGDTIGSLKCDCSNQLDLALKRIAKEGGLVIYHRQEGRNIGLVNKINAYKLQDAGYNTIQANLELGFKEDERDYRAVGVILKDLKISKVKLVTNNPTKIAFVEELGIEITERIPSITARNEHNEKYIQVKKEQMGHML